VMGMPIPRKSASSEFLIAILVYQLFFIAPKSEEWNGFGWSSLVFVFWKLTVKFIFKCKGLDRDVSVTNRFKTLRGENG
jgi:hypothetical protein